MRAAAGEPPIPLWDTKTSTLRQTDRIPGVQSDSSEPEGTKTLTWSLSLPWRQQIVKLHNQILRKQESWQTPYARTPTCLRRQRSKGKVSSAQRGWGGKVTYVATGRPSWCGCALESPPGLTQRWRSTRAAWYELGLRVKEDDKHWLPA